jgi:hypothetical protein
LEIASERRTTLSFDLEILGNKKSIRIKDNRNKLKISTTANIRTMSNSEREEKQAAAKMDENEAIMPNKV